LHASRGFLRVSIFACALVLVIPSAAQVPGGAGNAQAVAGDLPGAWEVRETAAALLKAMNGISAVLSDYRPTSWNGAPAAFAQQRESALAEAGYAERAAAELSDRPGSLAKAFELYMRIELVAKLTPGLATAARTYQNTAIADRTEAVLDQMAPSATRLRNYLMELAGAKERELELLDAEAQRCRLEAIRSKPATPKATKR
jgi:hypothetical protein